MHVSIEKAAHNRDVFVDDGEWNKRRDGFVVKSNTRLLQFEGDFLLARKTRFLLVDDFEEVVLVLAEDEKGLLCEELDAED